MKQMTFFNRMTATQRIAKLAVHVNHALKFIDRLYFPDETEAAFKTRDPRHRKA